jgi:hypothetical protein
MILIVRLKPAERSVGLCPPANVRLSTEERAQLAAETTRHVLGCAEQVQQAVRALPERVQVRPLTNLNLVLVTCPDGQAEEVRRLILGGCNAVESIRDDYPVELIP